MGTFLVQSDRDLSGFNPFRPFENWISGFRYCHDSNRNELVSLLPQEFLEKKTKIMSRFIHYSWLFFTSDSRKNFWFQGLLDIILSQIRDIWNSLPPAIFGCIGIFCIFIYP